MTDRDELRELVARTLCRALGCVGSVPSVQCHLVCSMHLGDVFEEHGVATDAILTALDEAGVQLVRITNHGNELYCFDDEDSDQ